MSLLIAARTERYALNEIFLFNIEQRPEFHKDALISITSILFCLSLAMNSLGIT